MNNYVYDPPVLFRVLLLFPSDIELANLRHRNSLDIQIRNTQAATLKEKFVQTLRRFQSSESEARKKYKGRLERQYKIGKVFWRVTAKVDMHSMKHESNPQTLFIFHKNTVKPDATQAEIQQALESDNQQIFAQSVRHRAGNTERYELDCVSSNHFPVSFVDSIPSQVLQSTRYGDANRALREVQTRHDDIKKIERTILVGTVTPWR